MLYERRDFRETLREVTGGAGLPVVYESVGKDTFQRSLECLRPRGILANFGHASGPPDPVDVIELGARGSLWVTRPTIMTYMEARDDMVAAAGELFKVVQSGAVKIEVNQTFALKDAARAQKMIEDGEVKGKIVLVP